MKVGFKDEQGSNQQADIEPDVYRLAADQGLSVVQYVNRAYGTDVEKYGAPFEQFMASCGMFMHRDGRYGIRPPTLDEVVNGKAPAASGMLAGSVIRDASPASRILFPAVFLEAIENKLVAKTDDYVAIFDSLVAVDDTINGPRLEQPVLNFSKPEAARAQAIGQMNFPTSMLSITTSDVARKIPTFSLGMEISDEALKASTLDLVALALTRQAYVQRAARVDDYIAAFVSGDADNGQAALSSFTTTSVDSLASGGVITHKSWIKYLRKNYRKRHLNWVMCDLATAMKIENRTGKPVVTTDNPTSNRIDALAQVANPQWQGVKIFLVEDGVIAADTIVGLDTRFAIRRVRNSQADYAAIEEFVLKKSKALRFDFGEIAYRFMDESWEVMTVA